MLCGPQKAGKSSHWETFSQEYGNEGEEGGRSTGPTPRGVDGERSAEAAIW